MVIMLDILKKTWLLGLGLASMTSEKIEELVDDLIKRGEVAEKDRSKAVDDLFRRMREEQEKLGKTVREYVKKTVHDMGLPTRDEFLTLKERVDALESEKRNRMDDGPPA
jgi:polyhydroxyalkanoate synthesis regulator phasin